MGYGDKPPGEPLTIRTNGRRYRIADPGGLMGKRLRNGAPYEKQLLREILGQGYTGTALDIGAHIGNHTLFLSIVAQLNVIAVEPFEGVRAQLLHNLGLNAERFRVLADRVQVIPVAVGAERGFGIWTERPNPKTGRPNRYLKLVDPTQVDPSKLISVYRLDDLVSGVKNISVVKIDVEGMEADVLQGASDLLAEHRPDVWAETHDDLNIREILDVLDGYEHRQDLVQYGTRMSYFRHE